MEKKEKEKVIYPQMKVLVESEAGDRQRKQDKITAMKMALTYIELRGHTVNPKETTKIANEFLEWLQS